GNNDASAFREALRKEESLLIVFGSEFTGSAINALVQLGGTLHPTEPTAGSSGAPTQPNAKFACLGDYVNSRGAADMGLYPDLLPGYVPLTSAGSFAEDYGSLLPAQPGLDLLQMLDAAERGTLKALYVVGANPV